MAGKIIGASYGQLEGLASVAGTGTSILNPAGAYYSTQTSSVTGAIKVTLPTSWTSTMLRFTVKIYEYTTGESFEVTVAGYNYGSSSQWINTSAYVLSDTSKNRNFNIRFGHDGTKCCVYIGETTSTWAYPQVAVTEFYAGYSNTDAETWNDNWAVGFATTLGTITSTLTNREVGRYVDGNLVFHDAYHPNADKWTTARTLSLTGEVTGSVSFDGSGNVSMATTLNNDALNDQFVQTGARLTGNGGNNLVTSIRLWDVSTAGDAPTGSVDGILTTGMWDSTAWATQQYHDFHTNELYIRNLSNTAWQSWERVAKEPHVASTAPASPVEGDFWYDDTEGFLNMYYNGAWVEASPAAASIAQGSGSGLDADTVDGYEASAMYRTVATASATAGAGWVTVATNTSVRRHGEIIVSDAESGDHAFIRIDWMRSYADNNFTVLNCGGHANRITGVRVLYQTSDITYGTCYLQVYVTTSSNYTVMINDTGAHDSGWSNHTVVTPVVQNTITGYAVHGNELTGLDTYGFAAEEGIRAGGSILAGGDVTAYSDVRFKHNIETIDNALDKVTRLRGTSYIKDNKESIGVIAQEVEEVIPEIVHTDGHGMKAVAYGNISAVLIEAIKEMDAKYQAKIDALEAQIEELKRNG